MKPGYITIIIPRDAFERGKHLLSFEARISHWTTQDGTIHHFSDAKLPVARTWRWPSGADTCMVMEPDRDAAVRAVSAGAGHH